MGGHCCGEKQVTKTIKVMTINYCGIYNSPFQFYISDYEPQLRTMGTKFEEYIQSEEGFGDKNIAKLMGKVEKQFKNNRYSPLFDRTAGVKKPNSNNEPFKPMNQEEFKKEWKRKFRKQEKNLREKCKKIENFDEQIDMLMKYDFLAFKAMVKYVYGQELKDCLTQKKTFEKYVRVLDPFFDFSFLNEDNKLSKFKYGYRKTNPDLFFITDYASALLKFLEQRATRNYFWYSNEEQIIILKNDMFGYERKTFEKVEITDILPDPHEYKKSGDAAKDKILAIVSEHYVIISLYLTSREEANKPQTDYLDDVLNHLREDPKYMNKTIIAGGDINSFHDRFPKGYAFYPEKQEDITTYKKRTALQVQIHKKDVIKKKSIDKIITNKKILHGAVTLIDGQQPDRDEKSKDRAKAKPSDIEQNGKGLDSTIKMLLPCDIHPFDQFLVKTQIEIPDYQAEKNNNKIIEGLLVQN